MKHLGTNTYRLADADHFVYDQKFKNLMERMNEYIKDRTEAFDDLFPTRKFSFRTVKNWISSFKFFYDFVFTKKISCSLIRLSLARMVEGDCISDGLR